MALTLDQIDALVARGPFGPTWESLESYTVPRWYRDAKFGIFIHWGPYAVPAFGNEWYPREMYRQGTAAFDHHVATYGPHKTFGYKDFIPRFTADAFDPEQWAQLFADSGARYVVPVAEHHDGFAMYDSDFSAWTATKQGPKRDIVGDLEIAVRKRGLHFGASSHRAEHCWFFNGGREFDSDVPGTPELYGDAHGEDDVPSDAFLDDWLLRCGEIVMKHRPEVFWFDWKIEKEWFQSRLRRFAAFYYNHAALHGYGPAINYKLGAMPDAAGVFDIERGKLDATRGHFWQTDTSICKKSWGAIAEHDYRTADSLIGDLIDIVSKNGCLLLNIAPRADGSIPDEQQAILRAIGEWLAVNGEAIYETHPWKVFGEGPTEVVGGSFKDTESAPFTAADIRFTARDEVLYALALAWPDDGMIQIASLAEGSPHHPHLIRRVHLLGHRAPLAFRRTPTGLSVVLPPGVRPTEHALALKIV